MVHLRLRLISEKSLVELEKKILLGSGKLIILEFCCHSILEK